MHDLPQLLSVTKFADERGSFSKLFCSYNFAAILKTEQINLVSNEKKGTLRGLHFQVEPYDDSKIIYCLTGAIFDVAVCISKNCDDRGKVFQFELSEEENFLLKIPSGYAHGYMTLRPKTQLLYIHDKHHHPEHESGINPLSSKLNIDWPLRPDIISHRDLNFPDYEE